MKIKDVVFDIGVCEGDFERAFGRKPKNQDELDDFGYECKKCIEGQIDWDIIFEVVKEDWEDE